MRTLLVIGSAPCFNADVKAALELRPLAELMLINGAATLIEHAEHVLSGHSDKAETFAASRRTVFPNAQPWRLHATADHKGLKNLQTACPSVTDWWDKTVCTGATSAGKAIKIGLVKLGYDEVIVCGCPLDASGYAPGEAAVPHFCHRVGDPKYKEHRVMKGYRDKFLKLAQSELLKGRVFAMSGFPLNCLGLPPRY